MLLNNKWCDKELVEKRLYDGFVNKYKLSEIYW